jgi:hypothetical protein
MDSNVLSFPITKAKPKARALSNDDARRGVETAETLRQLFTPLIKRPVLVSKDSPDGKGLALGPYKMPIIYGGKGEPVHTAGKYIDQLRGVRRYTQNSIELRCDALGLAVYVCSENQVIEGKVIGAVRVVAYDFDKVEPTFVARVRSHVELTNKLYTTLSSTFNRLCREYNLGGLDPTRILLRSQYEGFPDIHLISK